MNPFLSIQNLHVSTGDTPILRGLELEIGAGEVHMLMGPNGSGKTTLGHVLMGSPLYKVTDGDIQFKKESIALLSSDARARKGMFLGFQYPVEVQGVPMSSFLRGAFAARGYSQKNKEDVVASLASVGLVESFFDRDVNAGFSGGEKKRSEIAQLQLLEPAFAILDEFDSGLDVDGLKDACSVLRSYVNDTRSLLLITHYGAIAEYITPHQVHVMKGGKIVANGGKE